MKDGDGNYWFVNCCFHIYAASTEELEEKIKKMGRIAKEKKVTA